MDQHEEIESKPPNVYFGPLTLPEIKYTLSLQKPVEMIGRRATISESQPSRTVYDDSPTRDYLIKQQFFGDDEDVDVTFISEYFTPDETRNSESKYVTVDNDQQLNSIKTEDSLVKVSDSPKLETIVVSSDDEYNEVTEVSDCTFEDSLQLKSKIDICINRLNSDDDLEVEILNSSTEMQTTSANKPTVHKSPFNFKFNCHDDLEEGVNVLNQSDKLLVINENEAKQASSSTVRDAYQSTQSPMSLNKSDRLCVIEENEATQASSSGVRDAYQTTQSPPQTPRKVEESPVDKLEVSRNSLDLDFNDTLEEMEMALKYGLNYDKDNTSQIDDNNHKARENKIVQNQTSQCSKTEDESFNYGFNDTLEEMEMALQFGLDYDENSANSSSDTTFEKSHVIVTKTPSQQKSKTAIPVRKETKLKVEAQLKTLALTPNKDFQFKVPPKPVSTKKTPDPFKDIVSPVAQYIKNSPLTPLVRHIRPNSKAPLFAPATSTVTEITNKENELPMRICKLSKNVIVTRENNLKLPGSIQKYVYPAKVVKHQVKITKPKDASEVEKKLLAEDLTMMADDSLSASVLQDTSLHSIKNAF